MDEFLFVTIKLLYLYQWLNKHSSENIGVAFHHTHSRNTNELLNLFYFCRKCMKIDFYNLRDLQEPKFSHSVAPHYPGLLATAASSPGILIFSDQQGKVGDVGWLDFCNYPPKLANMNHIADSKESLDMVLYDMISCVTLIGEQLIIKSFGSGGICASVAITGKTKWEVKGRLPGMDKWMTARGIDTDRLGHLLVCDTANQCVQMFNFGGEYVRSVLRSGEQDLGTPFRIRWYRDISSAIVLHRRNERYYISVYCTLKHSKSEPRF